ncbi:exodeoxyribonuclease VII large subunit [Parvularcula maris]|uniref:Exodeoxyribonuclease 7 large subunit n=1 Tax=Parvularcula maris TaxID=2965077 RepID=A0A9X2L9M0_9PROT|nr:exodeoxyribonuclease VII large subunit [Parvularcula maris]MCQ8185646.1 exodeoxyribonuclease VII large subunit [Parvularcula maris]
MTTDNVPEYSVTELSGQLKRTIEDAYGYVRVRGELGRVTRAGSGHVYLDLKDDRAVLSSVMWKGTAQRQTVKPEQGMEVVATGRLTTFPGQSRYQLVIDTLAPAGAGALMALYEERKKKLAAEGLFDPARKRAIPKLPRRIGVVTSPSGAVIRDILHRLRDRYPSHVIVWPTLVQGERAAAGIVCGIKGLAALPEDQRPDTIIVARGGGSLEDLWCFNDEEVARAAAASPIPLISAVGHETDTTLIDFAADLRAPTPTAAAELAVPVRSELLSQVRQLGLSLEQKLAAKTEARGLALRSAARALGGPSSVLDTPAQRLDLAASALGRAIATSGERAGARLAQVTPRLQPSLLFRPVERQEAELSRRTVRLRPSLLTERADRRGERLTAAAPRLPRAALGIERRARDRLSAAKLRRSAVSTRLDRASEGLTGLSARLPVLASSQLRTLEDRLSQTGRLLQSMSYRGVLERGFALVTGPEGAVVTSAKAAKKAGALTLTFADGEHQVGTDPARRGKTKPPGQKTDQQKLF